MDPKEKFAAFLAFAQEEIQIVSHTLKEKGSNRFGRPLVLGLSLVLGAYMVVYKPAKSHLFYLNDRITAAKATAKYADQFNDLRDSLNGVYRKLPLAKDRQTYLLESTRDSLSLDGLVTDVLDPPGENDVSGLVYQKMRVQMSRLKFDLLTRWLQHVEKDKPFVRVTDLQIGKATGEPGQASVTCVVSTVIPVKKLGLGQ
jgi:type II secretory pathway component PulM